MSGGVVSASGGRTSAVNSGQSDVLRAELQQMTAQIGANAWASPPVNVQPVDAWVTAELNRRVEEQLLVARAARQQASGSPKPPETVASDSPTIASYARSTGRDHLVASAPLPSPPKPSSPPQSMDLAGFPEDQAERKSSRDFHLRAEAAAAKAAAMDASRAISPQVHEVVAQVDAMARSQMEREMRLAMADGMALDRELRVAASETAANMGVPGPAPSGAQLAAVDMDELDMGTLRHENYETVLGLLEEVEGKRRAEMRRRQEVEAEAEEARTKDELAVHELQLEKLELTKKLRRLQSSSSYASAFEIYDADISKLASQLEMARTEVRELEATCREASTAYEVARDAARVASGEQWPDGISATMEAKLGRIKNYRLTISTLNKELMATRAELADASDRLRKVEVHKRSAEEGTKRLHRMAKEYERVSTELTNVRLLASQAESQQRDLLARIEAANREATEARAQLAAGMAEVNGYKEQISALQYARRKDQVVMRMAPRLQTSAEKLRQHLLGRSHGRKARQPASGAGALGELLASLEHELQTTGCSPKAMITLTRVKQAAEVMEHARRDGSEREEELLQLLVENLAPLNEEGGLAAPSTNGSPGATRSHLSFRSGGTTSPRSSRRLG